MLHLRIDSPLDRLSRPLGGPGILVYMGLMTMLNIFGIVTIGTSAYRVARSSGLHFEFYNFWFQPSFFGVSLVRHLMAVNGLLVIYLWLQFRATGRHHLWRRIAFMGAALVLVIFQMLYIDVYSVEPPELKYRRLPISDVFPIPDPTPHEPEPIQLD